MPKLGVSATATQTVELTVTQRVKAMIKARCEEHARLNAEIKERKARQERIQKEVEELFDKEGQQAALAAGTTVDGFKVKRVCGTSRKLDKIALMRAVDLTAEELDAFFEETENKPYIRLTPPGAKGEE